MEKNYAILDCTLRDGGYVNNWEFSLDGAGKVMERLHAAGVEYIECGIMGRTDGSHFTTKFNNFDEIVPLLQYRRKNAVYTLMITFSEKDAYNIPPKSEKTVDCIRIAFFKTEMKEAVAYGEYLKELGYMVFLQAMATPLYSEEELRKLIHMINELKPEAFYIVDSFGTMFNDDIERIATFVDKELDSDIPLGFHAHNNLQMAFSNCICFLDIPMKRFKFIDSSVYGMGRGAGNVPSELIAHYLNLKCEGTYSIADILDVYELVLKAIFEKYYWGYSEQYFLTASKGINSAYGWYICNKGHDPLRELADILDKIPKENRYTLSKSIADNAISIVCGTYKGEK